MLIKDIINETNVLDFPTRKRKKKVDYDREKIAAPYGRESLTGIPFTATNHKQESFIIVDGTPGKMFDLEGNIYAEFPFTKETKNEVWKEVSRKHSELQLQAEPGTKLSIRII